MKRPIDDYKVADFDPFRPNGVAIQVAIRCRRKHLKNESDYLWPEEYAKHLVEWDEYLERHINQYEEGITLCGTL